jgi:uncharacterized protein YrrD
MLRRNDVIGIDVVELDSGRHVGQVQELVVDDSRTLKGLLIKKPSGTVFVKHNDIHAFGQDAVTLLSCGPCSPAANCVQKPWFLKVLGKPLLTEEGVDMGTIDDLCFDEESGSVIGFQVSGGLIQDLTEGKELLPLESGLTYGEDAVIVHDLPGS